jgi:uncharacterized protein YbjT (DUF2867 family)
MMKLLLAGGTGLVGRSLIALAKGRLIPITTVGRRITGDVENELVVDFTALPTLPAADTAICTLGATMGDAGSKDAFKAVDFDAVIAFARAAKESGVSHFLIVTAIGADSESRAFYSRVKGAVEIELTTIGFNRLDILRPGLLLGKRQSRRPVEQFLQYLSPMISLIARGPWSRYASISAEQLAGALLALCHETTPGVFYHQSPELQCLGGETQRGDLT